MASNGLVANPSKTHLMFIKLKQSEDELEEILVGNISVKQVKHAKLLGMTIDDDLEWKTHVEGMSNPISKL